jgi:hypothetical protein
MAAAADAAAFLEEHGAGFAAAAFAAEGFHTVGDLLDARLTDADLKELGLAQMMPRKRLQNALADVVRADGASVGGSAPISAPSAPSVGELSADDLRAVKALLRSEQQRQTPAAQATPQELEPEAEPEPELDTEPAAVASPQREAWGDHSDARPDAELSPPPMQQPQARGRASSVRRSGKLNTLEAAIYTAAQRYRAVQDDKYRPLKHLLLELFGGADSGARLRKPRSSLVEPAPFVELLSVRLGVETTESEAVALFGKHGPFEALNYQAFCRYLCAKPGAVRNAQMGNLTGGDSFELAAEEISAVDVRGSDLHLQPPPSQQQKRQQPGVGLSPPGAALSPRITSSGSGGGGRRAVGKDPAWRRSAEELLLKEQRDQERASAARAAYLEAAASAATKHSRKVASVSQREQHRHTGAAAADRRLEKLRQQEAAAERALLRVSRSREVRTSFDVSHRSSLLLFAWSASDCAVLCAVCVFFGCDQAAIVRCQKHDARGRQIRRNARRDRELRAAQGAERKLELQEMTIRADAVRRAALDEETSRARMFARRRREKRRAVRKSGEEWAALAEAEAVVECTFAPALPKKISYHHVASKAEREMQKNGGGVTKSLDEDANLRTSIGDRALAAQRQSLQMMRERRGAALDAQRKEVLRVQRQSVGGGKTQLSRGFRRGAFEAEDPSEWKFEGTIKHRLCKAYAKTSF